MKRIEYNVLKMMVLGIGLSFAVQVDASSVPSKRIKLVSGFIKEKGVAGLRRQLAVWNESGYTIDVDQNALNTLAHVFHISPDEASVYIADLNAHLSSGKGGSSGGASIGANGGTGFGSGSGPGSGGQGYGPGGTENGVAGKENGQAGGMIPGFSEGGIGEKGNGPGESNQPPFIPIKNDDEESVPPAPPMPGEKEKPTEKKVEQKKEKRAFEYTLPLVSGDVSLSEKEKVASDALFLAVLNRVMQTAYGDKQTKISDIVIDERGAATGPFDALATAIKVPSDREKMKVVMPLNGFEAYYLYLKDRFIALAGYQETYKKRKELRDLLGSEAGDGSLKKFITEKIQYVDLDSLYAALTKKSDLLNAWIQLFEPCFFDHDLVKDTQVRRTLETILINSIVARRSPEAIARARQITSDELSETLILDLLTEVTKEMPAQTQDVAQGEQHSEHEEGPNSLTDPIKKEKTKSLLNAFFSKAKPSAQSSTKEKTIFSLTKDYVFVLYDRLNRLRVNPRFCKEFDILGLTAAQQYQAAAAKGGVNGRLAIPLLLWLGFLETTKTARDCRDIALKQLFFDKEDLEGVLKDPRVVSAFTALFDFHMQEQKKNRKKINVGEFLNKEFPAQKDIRGLRSVLNRLESIVGSSATLTGLKGLCDSINIQKDTFLSMLNRIIDEQKGTPVHTDTVGAVAKIIEDYNKANEKKSAIIGIITQAKKEYQRTKKPVTKILYDGLMAANKKLNVMPAFKMQDMFFGLSRMPDTFYSLFSSSSFIGSGTELAKIVTKQEFRNYMVAYGLLLDVFKQAYRDSALLRNALEAMNQGVVKASERYPDAIATSNEMKALINTGLYKGTLQSLITALDRKDVQGMNEALTTFVTADPINPLGNTKQRAEFNTLLEDMKSSLAQQSLQKMITSIEVLNSGSGECPESAPDCLIPGISLNEKDVKRHNALFYQGLQNVLTPIVALLKPQGKAITPKQFKELDIEALKTAFTVLVEKTKNLVATPFFTSYWKQKTVPGQLNSEQQEMVKKVQAYADSFVESVMNLQKAVSVTQSPSSNGAGAPVSPGGIPPAPPMPGGEQGGIPLPPPPPGF
jgi:hypothetical protein